ncbi:MAG: tetratricopeptide repeat protein [Candidatus Eisenbacteria bacterium]|nr:tetratricopeptide repeat protein [Candidatus Eisenbacteria bacterium]
MKGGPRRRELTFSISAGARAACLLTFLVALSLALSSCGPKGGLSDRYVAEKLAWRARTLRRAMAENPDMATDEMRQRLESTYREIVTLFPPPGEPEGGITDLAEDVARISGMSRLRLAALLEERGEAAEARRFYATVADSFTFARDMSIEAASRLAASLERAGEYEEAASVLWSLVERWPPAEGPNEPPDQRVIGAARRGAGDLVSAGKAEPGDALARARDYYEDLVSRWSGTDVAAAALAAMGETYEMQGRWTDAVDTYEKLDREYGGPGTEASLWIKLGDLYSSGLGDNDKAAEYYRSVVAEYGDTPEGGAASISLARFDIGAGRYDEARSRLQSVATEFADEPALAATATQHMAASLELEGRPEDAIARYGELSASYPTSLYGLAAPLRVAEIYEEMDEDVAYSAALEGAAEKYERIIRDYAGSPAELAARNYLITVKKRQEEWPRVAELLLETASKSPEDPASVSMMFQAAGIYESQLSDEEAAREVLRAIAARYADGPAGERAARLLDDDAR